ncbi:MAG: hypothetical protein KHZ62_00765 [Clostridiales bacterium]|nr:hypothetical protein [Clostridiales bacterium]
MAQLKYKLIPEGAADGMIQINLIFIDKKDVDAAGLTAREACELVAKDYPEAAAIDIIDMEATTVTSDGIMAPMAVIAFASADHGKINKDFGFITVSEQPYSYDLIEDETHLKQWDVNFRGRRLYRGPTAQDKKPRDSHNENMTITGRIGNNNTGSEMMNMITMTEVLTPIFGMLSVMQDKDVLVGICGPEISVGIGMVVRERYGRIFHQSYGAGMTAHRSGVFAKTVKSDIPVMVGTKSMVADYTIRALEAGMVPAKDIGSSPVVLSVAKAMGFPMALDNITENAWIELESIGITREMLEAPSPKMTKEEVIAKADEILPGVIDGKVYNVSDIVDVRYVEC